MNLTVPRSAPLIPVGIVSDSDVVRSALARVIDEDAELSVIGVAANPREGRALLRERSLEVLVVGLALSAHGRRASGLKFIAQAKQIRNDISILSLKRGVEEPILRAAIDAGANACCLSGGSQARLVRAIKAVSAGGTWLDPELSDVVFRARNPRVAATPRLTPRERIVLQFITEGYTNSEMAAELHCSPGTIHAHITNLFAKLGVHDRTSAAVFAMRHGLISDNVI